MEKRKVIEGKNLLTTVEIYATVVAAEKASKKRKTVKGAQAKKSKSKAQKESSDEYEK